MIEVFWRLISARRTELSAPRQIVRSSCRRRCAPGSAREGLCSTLTEPGKRWQNVATERFKGKFKEYLGLEQSRSCARVERGHRDLASAIRRRSHSSLDYLTPNKIVVRQRNAAIEWCSPQLYRSLARGKHSKHRSRFGLTMVKMGGSNRYGEVACENRLFKCVVD